jgi:hypothetical protein
MLQHLPTAIFGLSMLALIINSTLDNNPVVLIVAVVTGVLAMAVIVIQERRAKGPPPSREEEIERWSRQRDTLRRSLDNARAQSASDQISFLESRLAEAEGKLKKLAR